MLSPFEVAASNNDIGYYAENTLAGSRLNTNIGDLAASITLVTRQQMLDTSAIDMNDVFLYEANTEGTKNFNAFEVNDTGGVDDYNATSPQTANRVRGMGAVDRGRNYYPSIRELPFDVYITESVEINRGPNSMLFGIGSASGLVNQTTSSANLKRQTGEVNARYGNENSFRSSVRFNQPIVADKLAVFGAVLYDSQGFTRKPSYDISRRAYGAVTYAPWSKTTIKANYEIYNQDLRRPNTVTPRDGISEWRAAGSPTWDPLTFTLTTHGVSRVITNAAGIPITDFTGIPLRVGPAQTRPYLFIDHGKPELWMQAALSNVGIRGAVSNQLPTLANSSTLLRNNAAANPLAIMPGISDRSLYDWGSINVISGQVRRQDARVYNVDVSQELLPGLFAQAGWYREDFKSQNWAYNQEEPVMIDVNTRLLDGTPNPYLGRPFSQFPAPKRFSSDKLNDNYRLNLAYTYNFSKKPGILSWLGEQRFIVLGARSQVDTSTRVGLPIVTSDHAWHTASNKLGMGLGVVPGNNIITRYFLGGNDGRITQEPGLMEPIFPLDIPLRHAIPGASNVLPYANPNNRYAWVNEPAHIDIAFNLNSAENRQRTDSLTLGLQSSMLRERVVTTFGLRRDKNITRTTLNLRIDPATGLADPADFSRFGPTQVLYGNTYTGGVVVKPFRWLSLTYNQSENFSPAPALQDLFGELLPLPTGRGKDYGFRIYPFRDNKLIFSFNSFESSAEAVRGTVVPLSRVNSMELAFTEWAGTVARTRLGPNATAADVSAEYERLVQFPPGYQRPEGAVGAATTSTIKARGAEAQLIYNPLRNWNIKATFGKQKSVYYNIAPEFDRYVEARLPVWTAARDDTGALFWATPNQPVVNTPANFWTGSVVAPTRLAKVLEGKRTRNQREWSASVISTYRIIEGRLKGVEVGGGARFKDKAIIGYRGAAPDSDGIVRAFDPNQVVFDNPDPAFDAWLSRSFSMPQLFNRNIRAKIQFNVRNMFESGNRLEAISVNPDGSPSTFLIVDPREWYLSTTLLF